MRQTVNSQRERTAFVGTFESTKICLATQSGFGTYNMNNMSTLQQIMKIK